MSVRAVFQSVAPQRQGFLAPTALPSGEGLISAPVYGADMARSPGFDVAVFDLDGTLYMTELSVTPAIKSTFAELGLPVPPDRDIDELIGKPTTFYREFLRERGGEMAREVESRVPARELELVRTQGRLFPHARETLEELRRLGTRTALLTNAGPDYLGVIMGTFHLGPLFDEISAFRKGEASKTERLRAVVRRLDVEAGGAVMVGDRRFDFDAAREAGVPSVGVRHGYGHEELALADTVIDDLWELVGMRRAALAARGR